MPGSSQGVFPHLEISEGLCVVRLRSDCARLFTGFTGLEISEGLCVIRLRSGDARLFTGGISSFGD